MAIDIGNQANWEGADTEKLESINSGELYAQPLREIETDVKQLENGDVEIVPRHQVPDPLTLGLGFKESHDAELNALLYEEPENLRRNQYALAPSGPISIAEGDDPKKRNRGCLVYYGIAPNWIMAVTGDRVLVEKDGVESEWACRTCKGNGYIDEPCPSCNGSLSSGGGPCRDCGVIGFGNETVHSSGKKICPDCSARGVGTGWKGRIIIPEAAQDIPMTGHVVSVGPQTLLAQLGDRVLFSKYAGHNLNNKQGSYQIMLESEILAILREK